MKNTLYDEFLMQLNRILQDQKINKVKQYMR